MARSKLRDMLPVWPASTLGQRVEDARMLLNVHGFLRESENMRISAKIQKRWDDEYAELSKPQRGNR